MFAEMKILWRLLRCGFLVCVILGSGCNSSTNKEEPSAKKSDNSTKSDSTPTKMEDDGITVKKVNYQQLEEAVSKHSGDVVVMDLWGDWCLPCKQKFPKFVKLSQKYADKKVTFMSLCLPSLVSEEKDLENKVLTFVRKNKATFANFLLTEKDWDQKFDTFGAPAVRIYGTDGKLVQQFSPGEPSLDWTYEDVEKVVQKLLANN